MMNEVVEIINDNFVSRKKWNQQIDQLYNNDNNSNCSNETGGWGNHGNVTGTFSLLTDGCGRMNAII